MGEEAEKATIEQPPEPTTEEVAIDDGVKVEDSVVDDGWKPVEAQTDYFSTTGEKMNLMIPTTQPQSRPAEKIIIPSLEEKKNVDEPIFHVSKSPVQYTQEQINSAADLAISGKKIDTKDPFFIAEVIEELTSRRIDLISQSEYKKAKVMVDAIEHVKALFRADDYVRFREKYLENLQERAKEQLDRVKDLQQNFRTKIDEKKAAANNELKDLHEKQEKEREKLINDWQDPAKQRRFNKQSPELIRNKALERYLALVGELEDAENLKKQNKRMEKKEISEKYKLMEEQFVKAQNKLDEDLQSQYDEAKKNLEFEITALAENNRIELERARIKSNFLQKMVKDEMKHQSKTPRINVMHSTAIPMLQKTVANVAMKNKFKYNTSIKTHANPLPLPPLVVKQRRKPARSVLIK